MHLIATSVTITLGGMIAGLAALIGGAATVAVRLTSLGSKVDGCGQTITEIQTIVKDLQAGAKVIGDATKPTTP